MKYIESDELREWVKDNLRKTIFQKAHALAVQTGCEVLVKLQDTQDITGRQYYATHNLQRAYNHNALRKHPAEMLVSGETGLPLVNESTQIGEISPEDPDVASLDNGNSSNGTHVQVTSANQTDLDDVQVKTEPMSDEDSSITDISQENSTVDGESGMDFDMFPDNATSSRHVVGRTSHMGGSVPSQSHLYQCAICQKTFRTINILQMHTQTFHTRGMTMASPIRNLNVRSKGKSGRKSHFKQERDLKRFQCSMCERTFHHPDLLKDHVSRSHMGQSFLAKIHQTSSTTTDTSIASSQIQAESSTQNNLGASTSDIDGMDPLDPRLQMSPVKSLIPTEAFLGNLGNRPAAMFGGNVSTPFKHPSGGGASRNGTPNPNQGDQPKGPMPTIKVMKAILAIGGPVSTSNTVKDNLRNRNYERVTNENFLEAANTLKDMGLGYLVACKNGSGRLVDVFVKKPPEEVMDLLDANSGLCDPIVYATTFASATPVRLMRSSQLIENLIASGLVSEEHLKSHVKPDINNQPNYHDVGNFYEANMQALNMSMNMASDNIWNQSDAQVLDQSGANVLDQTGANVLDQTGANVLDQTGANVLDQSGADVLDQTGADVLDQSETNIMDQSDGDLVNQSGAEILSSDPDVAIVDPDVAIVDPDPDVQNTNSSDSFTET